MGLCFHHYSPGKNSNLNAPVLLRQGAALPTHYRTERDENALQEKNVLHYFVDLSCSHSLQAAVKLLALGSLYIRAEEWWRRVTLKWGLSDSPPLWLTDTSANTHLLHLRGRKDAATRTESFHLNVYFPHCVCVCVGGGNKCAKCISTHIDTINTSSILDLWMGLTKAGWQEECRLRMWKERRSDEQTESSSRQVEVGCAPCVSGFADASSLEGVNGKSMAGMCLWSGHGGHGTRGRGGNLVSSDCSSLLRCYQSFKEVLWSPYVPALQWSRYMSI